MSDANLQPGGKFYSDEIVALRARVQELEAERDRLRGVEEAAKNVAAVDTRTSVGLGAAIERLRQALEGSGR